MSSPAVCRICHSGDNSLPYFGEALARSLISSCDLSASEWFIVYLIYYRFPATQQLCVHSTFSQIHVQVIVAAFSHQQTVNFVICTWAYFLLFSVFHGRSNNRTTFQRHYRNASSLLHALLVADEFHEMLWDLQARVQDRQVCFSLSFVQLNKMTVYWIRHSFLVCTYLSLFIVQIIQALTHTSFLHTDIFYLFFPLFSGSSPRSLTSCVCTETRASVWTWSFSSSSRPPATRPVRCSWSEPPRVRMLVSVSG